MWCTAWEPRLSKWMADLGYHHSRHADEFGAYLLTEPASFWRGRIRAEELRAVRDELVPATRAARASPDDDAPSDVDAMLGRTREALRQFFAPYNQQLLDLLHGDCKGQALLKPSDISLWSLWGGSGAPQS